MNIELYLDQLAKESCPGQVDVVDKVMAEVRRRPYLMPTRRKVVDRRVALTVAAAVVAAAIFGVPALMGRSYNESRISSMMVSVQDYDYYQPVESAAPNPLAYLYEDEMPIE